MLLLLRVTRGSKAGSAVLDATLATLGEAQVGRDEKLGIGIAEDRLGGWEAGTRRECVCDVTGPG